MRQINVDEACAVDKASGNALWTDAVAKEMKNVAFDFKEGNEKTPIGFQEVRCWGWGS